MKTRDTEKKVLEKALEALQKATKLTAEAHPIPFHEPHGPDARIRITWQKMEWNYAAGIVNRLTRAMVGGAVQQLMKYPEKGILITRYVTPQMADILKEMDIPFVDTVGNVYINEPPLFILIKGNRLAGRQRAEPVTRAFRPAGLQVVFALLCNPGLEDFPFREIAKVATVALGTVTWVIQDLKQTGYLVDMGTRGRRLLRKDNLLARWVTTYPEQLRPKQLVGRYRTDNFDWWKATDLRDFRAYWGGEIGAALLTEYLRPQTITIYTHKPLGKLLLQNRIRKDPRGDIEVLRAFWKFEYNWVYPDMVHPLLIYADLLATGDARNIETAKMIHEQHLARFIREN